MPMPPALASCLPYSLVSRLLNTSSPWPPPNSGSVLTPSNMCDIISERNTASNCFAASAVLSGALPGICAGMFRGDAGGVLRREVTCMLHHLDIGLQCARGLDGLQNGDDVARADAQGIQARDQILQ